LFEPLAITIGWLFTVPPSCRQSRTALIDIFSTKRLSQSRRGSRRPTASSSPSKGHARRVLSRHYPRVDLRSIAKLRADFGRWIQTYDTTSSGLHRRRWCFGKTPMQIFLDAKPLTKEKMIAAFARTTRRSDPAPEAVCQTKFQVLHLARVLIVAGSLPPTCNTPSPLKSWPASSTTQTSPL
jgi:hypothetical protein